MRRLIAASAALAAWAGGAWADPPLSPDQIIAARQAGFALMGGAFGPLKGAAGSGQDLKPLAESAKAIAAWAALVPSLFPAGTETGRDTRAKPEIWSDRAGFERDAEALGTAAKALAVLAEANDGKGFAAQFEVAAKACGDCHKAYRVKRQ
jgi:cytochrome c556